MGLGASLWPRGPQRSDAFWLGIGVIFAVLIVVFTLGPLPLRPKTGHPNIERFLAYFLMAAALSRALPRWWLGVAIAVVAIAVGLEAAQLLIPGRDGWVTDAMVKALGGIVGVIAGLKTPPMGTKDVP